LRFLFRVGWLLGDKTISRHRFARSFDAGATWTDQILQSFDPRPLVNAATGFLWGDHQGPTATRSTEYSQGNRSTDLRSNWPQSFFERTRSAPALAAAASLATGAVGRLSQAAQDTNGSLVGGGVEPRLPAGPAATIAPRFGFLLLRH